MVQIYPGMYAWEIDFFNSTWYSDDEWGNRKILALSEI